MKNGLQGTLTHDLRPSRVNHRLMKPGRKSKRDVSEMKVKCPHTRVELEDDLQEHVCRTGFGFQALEERYGSCGPYPESTARMVKKRTQDTLLVGRAE